MGVYIQNFSVFESSLAGGISSPSPEFTPHEKFQNYTWLIPPGGEGGWYYRVPSDAQRKIPTGDNFMATVDPDLIKSVRHLHSIGVPTTPSCSGHFDEEGLYRKMYDDLKNQEKIIQTSGLELRDPETGRRTKYQSPTYKLPWDKDVFVGKAKEHSKFGVLGMVDPDNHYFDLLTSARIPSSQCLKDGDYTLFLTSPSSEGERKTCWEKFTRKICL